jgi:hypothetical protein
MPTTLVRRLPGVYDGTKLRFDVWFLRRLFASTLSAAYMVLP